LAVEIYLKNTIWKCYWACNTVSYTHVLKVGITWQLVQQYLIHVLTHVQSLFVRERKDNSFCG